MLGLAIILISQSWAFNQQSTGVAAVPVSPSDASGKPDPLSLAYTTRFGDTAERVLVVMVSGADPVQIPLDRLPRWNDAAGEAMPLIRLHKDPVLAATVGFETRIVPTAYVADGTLTEHDDGQQIATPTPADERNLTALPYPANALLAVEITTDTDAGTTADDHRLAAVRARRHGCDRALAFLRRRRPGPDRPGIPPGEPEDAVRDGGDPAEGPKEIVGQLYVADSDSDERLTQPAVFNVDFLWKRPVEYVAHDHNRSRMFELSWINVTDSDHALVALRSKARSPFIIAGLVTFVFGVVLDLAAGLARPGAQAQQARCEITGDLRAPANRK